MAVITQEYDIDLKATGEYPVVKMSQFDTGSRTIVFTVYDGHDLAQIDGMVARVDGTRSDGVEFSSTCTVGTGGKVSFTISQEMTKYAGKHTAELVIFDADGNPIGTQNFIIEVEAASMSRDSAASADDRTLYDQFTDSVSKAVADKIDSVSKEVAGKIAQMDTKYADFTTSMSSKADRMNLTAEDLRGLVVGARSVEVLNVSLDVSKVVSSLSGHVFCRVVYDPITALVTCRVSCSQAVAQKAGHGSYSFEFGTIADKYLPDAELFDYVDSQGLHGYRCFNDTFAGGEASASISRDTVGSHHAGGVLFVVSYSTTLQQVAGYRPNFVVAWYARGGKYLGVTPTGTGGNTLKVGKTTTGAPGTQASVAVSGTVKDVVLDFTIPKGDKGDTGARGNRVYYAKYESAPNSGSHWWADLNPTVSKADPPIAGDFVLTPSGNLMSITSVTVDASAGGGGLYGVGAILANLKGAKGDKGTNGVGVTAEDASTVSVGTSKAQRRIVNVGTPTADADAATKAYVDNLIAKLKTANGLK